jgi:putative PIN family toxin of toxin-antitoxin system
VLKAVIDANVWVSALLNPGKAQDIKKCFELGLFELYNSKVLLEELLHVLARPKLASRIKSKQATRLLQVIERKATMVKIQPIAATSRDPKDDPYLACAQASQCDFLVTGDKDLLILKTYGTTKIVTPAEFLLKLRSD